ncbi:MAG: ankyrin repeat domain-containing protein [Desulfurobacteriaceae bacterium]
MERRKQGRLFPTIKRIDQEHNLRRVKKEVERKRKVQNSELTELLKFVEKKLSLDVEKTKKDKEEINELFKKLGKFENIDEDPICNFLKGRFLTLKGEFEKACECYWKAVKNGKGQIGKKVELAIKEGLLVSTQLKKRKETKVSNTKGYFEKFYKEAVFHNLFEGVPSNVILNKFSRKFSSYFKNSFPKMEKETEKSLLELFNLEEEFKPDYRHPNRIIKKFSEPVSQLALFAGLGKHKVVKRLLEKGADPNWIRETDNYTPLIAALKGHTENREKGFWIKVLKKGIEMRGKDNLSISEVLIQILENKNKLTKDHLKIAKELIPKMSKKAINAKLRKEKETALSLAIGKGLVEIVKLLIDHEANVDDKIHDNEISPLAYSIQVIAFIKEKKRLLELLDSEENLLYFFQEKRLKSSFTRGLDSLNLPFIFDSEKNKIFRFIIRVLLKSKKVQKFLKEVLKVTFENSELYLHNNLENAYEIFDLLLKRTQNVDQPSKSRTTPLILAVWIGDEKLIKKLLEKRANPKHKDQYGKSAYDYACESGNKKIIKLLENYMPLLSHPSSKL